MSRVYGTVFTLSTVGAQVDRWVGVIIEVGSLLLAEYQIVNRLCDGAEGGREQGVY